MRRLSLFNSKKSPVSRSRVGCDRQTTSHVDNLTAFALPVEKKSLIFPANFPPMLFRIPWGVGKDFTF